MLLLRALHFPLSALTIESLPRIIQLLANLDSNRIIAVSREYMIYNVLRAQNRDESTLRIAHIDDGPDSMGSEEKN
jgi:hypothetical protein